MTASTIRHCIVSGQPFQLTEDEIRIYRHLGIPLPVISPDERAKHRLAWRNERTLYRRPCSATGKSIVSIFDTDTPFPVFSQEYWWSDRWDGLAYGREFDFSRPFFPQFAELFRVVPQCALRCPNSENSEFTNQCENNKDCYMVFCSNGSRECLHGMWFQQCTDCVDCTYLESSELCYEILNGKNCYGCTSSHNIQNCSNCHFSRDLIGCQDCIGCVNLRNKRHCLFNRQLSEAEFASELQRLKLHSAVGRAELAQKFAKFSEQLPVKYYIGKNNELFSGDYLENNRNTQYCFNVRNSENLVHCRDAWSGRNSADLTETLEQDFCVQLEGCCANTEAGFSSKISESSYCWYCSHCFSVSNLFGCVGLKQQRYCILNKQYSKDDFVSLRQRIIEHMQSTNEWGAFFPMAYSPFAYNESVAQEYFPLSEAQTSACGLRWKRLDKTQAALPGTSTPDSILDVDSSILESVLQCDHSGRSFKLQRAEFEFYKKLRIPIPRLHPDVRHAARMQLRNHRQLNPVACAGCQAELLSTYSPAAHARVFCESCYSLRTV